jgi:nucleoside phosphorylase
MPIGIMAAMQEEIDTLLKELSAGSEVVNEGRRTYHSGHLLGRTRGHRLFEMGQSRCGHYGNGPYF